VSVLLGALLKGLSAGQMRPFSASARPTSLFRRSRRRSRRHSGDGDRMLLRAELEATAGSHAGSRAGRGFLVSHFLYLYVGRRAAGCAVAPQWLHLGCAVAALRRRCGLRPLSQVLEASGARSRESVEGKEFGDVAGRKDTI